VSLRAGWEIERVCWYVQPRAAILPGRLRWMTRAAEQLQRGQRLKMSRACLAPVVNLAVRLAFAQVVTLTPEGDRLEYQMC